MGSSSGSADTIFPREAMLHQTPYPFGLDPVRCLIRQYMYVVVS